MPIEKPGRLTKLWKYFQPEERQIDDAKKTLDRANIWRAASSTDLAREVVEVCKEIEAKTYQDLISLILGDLGKYSGEELKSILRAYQARLITVKTIMGEFVPSEEQLKALLEVMESQEKEEEIIHESGARRPGNL